MLEKLSGALELPQDVVLDLSRVILVGRLQLQVENHKGVIEFSPSRIRIATAHGEVIVTGTRLFISAIYEHEVLVSGQIDGLQLL
ncbi:MAG TPA: sporulation protein YqfC [Firmicutes bacterium]|nr:sporulation protein YqfC [Bacillota bacterium]